MILFESVNWHKMLQNYTREVNKVNVNLKFPSQLVASILVCHILLAHLTQHHSHKVFLLWSLNPTNLFMRKMYDKYRLHIPRIQWHKFLEVHQERKYDTTNVWFVLDKLEWQLSHLPMHYKFVGHECLIHYMKYKDIQVHRILITCRKKEIVYRINVSSTRMWRCVKIMKKIFVQESNY